MNRGARPLAQVLLRVTVNEVHRRTIISQPVDCLTSVFPQAQHTGAHSQGSERGVDLFTDGLVVTGCGRGVTDQRIGLPGETDRESVQRGCPVIVGHHEATAAHGQDLLRHGKTLAARFRSCRAFPL